MSQAQTSCLDLPLFSPCSQETSNYHITATSIGKTCPALHSLSACVQNRLNSLRPFSLASPQLQT